MSIQPNNSKQMEKAKAKKADQKAKVNAGQKRKNDMLVVVDWEGVENNGKRYKKITRYIPYIDLT